MTRRQVWTEKEVEKQLAMALFVQFMIEKDEGLCIDSDRKVLIQMKEYLDNRK